MRLSAECTVHNTVYVYYSKLPIMYMSYTDVFFDCVVRPSCAGARLPVWPSGCFMGSYA